MFGLFGSAGISEGPQIVAESQWYMMPIRKQGNCRLRSQHDKLPPRQQSLSSGTSHHEVTPRLRVLPAVDLDFSISLVHGKGSHGLECNTWLWSVSALREKGPWKLYLFNILNTVYIHIHIDIVMYIYSHIQMVKILWDIHVMFHYKQKHFRASLEIFVVRKKNTF